MSCRHYCIASRSRSGAGGWTPVVCGGFQGSEEGATVKPNDTAMLYPNSG